MYYVYIIYSATTDKYYVGSCQDLNRRLTEHNTGRSTYTKTGAPWDLKWQSTFETRSLAVKEERRIKAKKSRKFIEYLIHGQAG
ncbi:MAG: GIY-YIG nuclease family protein [Lewinellaceae bacterium]|nr:GIY-YIG nuclease family protein [Lewinellaceae bacterium]MCB9333096.1 GIY-YIG nuclease family protein [Lewinellaceae bacterium]